MLGLLPPLFDQMLHRDILVYAQSTGLDFIGQLEFICLPLEDMPFQWAAYVNPSLSAREQASVVDTFYNRKRCCGRRECR